jgi:hypothetical protein
VPGIAGVDADQTRTAMALSKRLAGIARRRQELCAGFNGAFEVILYLGATTRHLEDGEIKQVA